MTAGTLTSVKLTEAYLVRMDEIDSAGPDCAQLLSGTRMPSALRSDGQGAHGWKSARADAWNSRAGQRQHRHRRPHDDHGRIAGVGRHSRLRATRSSSSACAPPAPSSSAKQTSANGRISVRRARPAAGVAAAGRHAIRTCSIAIRADRARAPARPLPQALRRSAWARKQMDRSSARRRFAAS